jgi:hypothetical protein
LLNGLQFHLLGLFIEIKFLSQDYKGKNETEKNSEHKYWNGATYPSTKLEKQVHYSNLMMLISS